MINGKRKFVNNTINKLMPSMPTAKLIPRFFTHGTLNDKAVVASVRKRMVTYTETPNVMREQINAIIRNCILPGTRQNNDAINGRIIKANVNIRSPGLVLTAE